MSKRMKKFSTAALYVMGVATLAVSLLATVGGSAAHATSAKPADVSRVTVGTTPGLLGAGHVWIDHRRDSGCSSNAYVQAWAQYNVGAVTATSVYVRSIKVTFRAGRGGTRQGAYMIRGNGGTVRQFGYAGGIPSGGVQIQKTYSINATVPWDGGRRVYFGANFETDSDTGGIPCTPAGHFRWYLEKA